MRVERKENKIWKRDNSRKEKISNNNKINTKYKNVIYDDHSSQIVTKVKQAIYDAGDEKGKIRIYHQRRKW